MLLRLAAEQHVTVPRLLVESALAVNKGETATERRQALAELFAVHRMLAAVSNNLNQIARKINAGGRPTGDLAATLAAVRRSADRIDAAVDELSLS